MDDRRQRNHPPGNAQGRSGWPNERLPIVGEPPSVTQNDGAALVKAVEIPEIVEDDGTRARIICGTFWGKRGPIEGIAADPIYIDVSVPPGRRKTLPVEITRHAFAYVFS